MARLARLAPASLSRVETGTVQPTLGTLCRIACALRVPVGTLLEGRRPDSPGAHPPCPVTESGDCLLDLVRQEKDIARADDSEVYTPRQLRLLKRFAAWLRRVGPDRLTAMEVLLAQLLGDDGEIAPAGPRDRDAKGAVRRPR